MIKILFCGTGNFAQTVVAGLLTASEYELSGVVTQPDRPSGRKQEMTASPVKQYLTDHHAAVKLFQPEKLTAEVNDILAATQPDLIIVADYGQFIPNVMLNYPRYKCINIHASLLPALRGAVPMPIAILQGLPETGVTIQIMAEKMDVGDILSSLKYQMLGTETTGQLTEILSAEAVDLLLTTLPKWIKGEITPIPQDESKATYCYQRDIAKERAQITFQTDINLAERMVRAFNPWPVAWVELAINGQIKRVKIFAAEISTQQIPRADSLQISKVDKRLFLQLHDGALELLQLQVEGKKRGEASEHLYLVTEQK